MKKILIVSVILLITASCGKESIEWIKPWYHYDLAGIYLLNANGTASPIKGNLFPGASSIEFVKNHTGFLGDGVITVTRDNFQTQNYSGYQAAYDNSCGCYYYAWQDYYVYWNNQQTNSYKYNWKWIAQKRLQITFADYNFNGTLEEKSFLKLLDGVYTVREETRKFGTLEADIISLTKDNIRLVIKQ